MNQIFINSIEEMQQSVRIPKSFPFSQLLPYLNDAYMRHLHYYIGPSLNGRLQENPGTVLFDMVRSALGPLALAMASPEIGVLMSDSGHLVKRDGNYTAANLDKILRAEKSMIGRGFSALANLLSYLHELEKDYPEWQDSAYRKTSTEGLFLPDACCFQNCGNVFLPNGHLDYHALLPLIRETERKFAAVFGRISHKLHAYMADDGMDVLLEQLLQEARIWTAATVARMNVLQHKERKEAHVRPLRYCPQVDDMGMTADDAAGYYQGVVDAAACSLRQLMADHEEELGIQVKNVSDFNTKEQHIFVL